jgi:hypothetical protein
MPSASNSRTDTSTTAAGPNAPESTRHRPRPGWVSAGGGGHEPASRGQHKEAVISQQRPQPEGAMIRVGGRLRIAQAHPARQIAREHARRARRDPRGHQPRRDPAAGRAAGCATGDGGRHRTRRELPWTKTATRRAGRPHSGQSFGQSPVGHRPTRPAQAKSWCGHRLQQWPEVLGELGEEVSEFLAADCIAHRHEDRPDPFPRLIRFCAGPAGDP